MFKKSIYNIVCIITLLVALGFFFFQYLFKGNSFSDISIYYLLSVLPVVLIVYLIKCFRLYLILYGTGMDFKTHITQFLKTASVNILIPFKMGELFRIYCYGYALRNMINGLMYILMDRFMDTLALATLIVLMNMFAGFSFSFLFYCLVLFLVAVIVMYFIFPPIYAYWNTYFIETRASVFKLRALDILERSNTVYTRLRDTVHSKGLVLYVISLIAWIAEGFGYYLVNSLFAKRVSVLDLLNYLDSALGLTSSDFNRLFVFISVIVSMTVYAFLAFGKRIKRRSIK